MTTSLSSVWIYRASLIAGLLLGCSRPGVGPPPDAMRLTSAAMAPAVFLDGKLIPVNWDDGDTFSTPDRAIRARLAGYNTLESYGPVHRWGDWTAAELYLLAKAAGARARTEVWTCTTQAGGGGYGRQSVDCPDLRRALLQEGLAHTFSVEGEASAEDQVVQAQAIANEVGIWAKGVPAGIVTSVHSLDEREGAAQTYDRVCSTATGTASKTSHAQTYAACSEVCRSGSCLVYVPYSLRYGESRADCLRPSAAPSPAEQQAN